MVDYLQLLRGTGKGDNRVQEVTEITTGLKALAKELKKRCGVGGSTRDASIEIQGDARDTVKQELEKRGYTVKLAGG